MGQAQVLAEVTPLCKRFWGNNSEYHDLVGLINRICEANGLQLTSGDDLRELERIPSENNFASKSHAEQLSSDGIAILDGRSSSRKGRRSDLVWGHAEEGDLYLNLRDDNLEVLVKPKLMSPLGATILSWVLVPSPSNASVFLRVLGMLSFENCLVHFVQGKHLPTTSSPIVMPAGWLYWLDLRGDFVQDHVEFFNHAVSVAKPFSKKGAKDGTKSAKTKSKQSDEESKEQVAKGKSQSDDSLTKSVNLKSKSTSDESLTKSMSDNLTVTVEASESKSEVSRSKWKDALSKGQLAQIRAGKVKVRNSSSKKNKRGKSCKGVLLLDQSNRLIYIPNTKSVPKWEITGVNASAEAFGSSVGAGYSRQRNEFHSEKQKLLFAGHVVPFYSLSHFMRFDFGDCAETDAVGRMKWLKLVLDRKAVFPKGMNQSFLIAMTGDSHRNTHVNIFPDSDCRITLNSLNHHRVYQDKEYDPQSIYFQAKEEHCYYRATCMETKSGFHMISQLSGPETLDDVSDLYRINKDLG